MKIALIGYGKMGKTIAELAKNQQHEIILTIDADNKNDLQSDCLGKEIYLFRKFWSVSKQKEII